LGRPDDFYISLFGELYDILEAPDEKKNDILPIAKGLEIYSLNKKKDTFKGINDANNILFAAGLYYLADYAASAYILSNLYSTDRYETDIEKFALSFFKRRLDNSNPYSSQLNQFLNSGDRTILDALIDSVRIQKEAVYSNNAMLFSVFYLTETILKRFSTNNLWTDLLRYNTRDHWAAYIDRTIKKPLPIWDFFPSQKNALEKGILNEFRSISLQTPTSSGKTAICELIIYNEVRNNADSKILYLAPFRALAAELKQSFGRNLARLGITSKTIYGGNIPSVAEKELIQNVSLLISTPEKFMAIESVVPDFLRQFTIIICDEGHLLNDRNRGLSYELLLSRLKSQTEVARKFIFISAIIPNIERINTWLGGSENTVVRSSYRATEIEYGFLKPYEGSTTNFLLDVNPFKRVPQNYKLNRFLTDRDFIYTVNGRDRTYRFTTVKVKSVAIALKSLNSGSVALFTPSKGGVTGVAALSEELIKQVTTGLRLPTPVNFVPNPQIIGKLSEYFRIILGPNYILTRLIQFGALLHHGDLPQYVREVIEDALRKEDVKLIICTNTLAEGVNLPIRTIVINSARRFNEVSGRQEPINLRDLKNLVGRAGRAGKETKGLVIIVNENDFGTIENVIKEQSIEDVNGHFYYIISSIAAIIQRRRLVLTNEILENQDEAFKELIDSVDVSIIDLLGEEISPDELQTTIQNLVNETFAKFQSNENESQTLSTLASLRGERIRPFIENNEFKYIKQSGANIRTYTDIQANLALDNPIWQTLADPISDEWLAFIIDDRIATQAVVQYKLVRFNNENDTNLTFAEIKTAIKLWVGGDWFEIIAATLNIDLDISLRFINNLIGFNIQSNAATIIRNVQMRLEEQRIAVSNAVLNFPQCLAYGLQTGLQLDLVEIGFNDRIGIIALDQLLTLEGFNYTDLTGLKNYLRDNRERLLLELSGVVPQISYERTDESFYYLGILNIS